MSTYERNKSGKCPHCLIVVRFDGAQPPIRRLGDTGDNSELVVSGPKEDLLVGAVSCPACGQLIITVTTGEYASAPRHRFVPGDTYVVWPRATARPVPPEVPTEIAEDYREAALVLQLSPKASAALSRRCLQAVLRGAGYTQRDLAQQIDATIPNLPSQIAENVDAIRQVGNFAAHPMKSQSNGEIVEVEPGEAEWNLDVLDDLFDFYYVQPAVARRKRAALDAKLADAGKPPMK
jgi:Domain of unknown function (DUF4145)